MKLKLPHSALLPVDYFSSYASLWSRCLSYYLLQKVCKEEVPCECLSLRFGSIQFMDHRTKAGQGHPLTFLTSMQVIFVSAYNT